MLPPPSWTGSSASHTKQQRRNRHKSQKYSYRHNTSLTSTLNITIPPTTMSTRSSMSTETNSLLSEKNRSYATYQELPSSSKPKQSMTKKFVECEYSHFCKVDPELTLDTVVKSIEPPEPRIPEGRYRTALPGWSR